MIAYRIKILSSFFSDFCAVCTLAAEWVSRYSSRDLSITDSLLGKDESEVAILTTDWIRIYLLEDSVSSW